ncbi:uncharacterized protein JCM6883_000367 [Sporobolomyces salmoneus]|uniref:uncharacterized protein n=1 Tax=Sporobolomyces salmoneus TaxID=183962 RepID=UPI00316BF359
MKLTLAAGLVATLASTVSANPSPEENVLNIPLQKRQSSSPLTQPDGCVNFNVLDNQMHRVKGKYQETVNNYRKAHGVAPPLSKRDADVVVEERSLPRFRGVGPIARGLSEEDKLMKRAGSTGQEALIDEQNESLWAGYITIGSNSQSFLQDFDTGSADLWVPGSGCTSSACSSKHKYNPSTSSTSATTTKQLDVSYGDGSTSSGPAYSDSVTVAGLTASKQVFGSATTLSSSFGSSPEDGLVGMAFPSISQLQTSPFFQTLISQGKVASPQFSFKLTKSGASLDLGSMVSSRYVAGTTQWTPVTSKSYWNVQAQTQVNGKSVSSLGTFAAIVDTGTTLIVAPTSSAKSFYASVPGSAPYSNGYYTFPCSSVPSVSFTFPGMTAAWTIPASTFNLGRVSSTSSLCVGALVGQDVGIQAFIMGDRFLSSVYSTYDVGNARVGFSKLA